MAIRSIFLIFGLILIYAFSCNKGLEDCEIYYHFNVPVSLSPEQDSFQIGDTITIEYVLDNLMVDTVSNMEIDVSSFDFAVFSGLHRIEDDNWVVGEDEFEIIEVEGEIVISQQFYLSKFKTFSSYSSNNERIFKVHFVPKVSGAYYFSFYNLTEDLHNPNFSSTRCAEILSINYSMNEGRANNYNYLVDGLTTPTNTPEGFQREGGYAFTVAE